MKLKKLLSVVLVFVLFLCSLTVIASAEENPEQSGADEVKVSIAFRPLKSYIVVGVSSPDLEGTVLKIIYPDGTSENVTIEKSDSDSSGYVAGKHRIYTQLFNDPQLISFGLNTEKIIVRCNSEDGAEYSGMYSDYKYLYIPSAEEIFYFISALVRMYSPFN